MTWGAEALAQTIQRGALPTGRGCSGLKCRPGAQLRLLRLPEWRSHYSPPDGCVRRSGRRRRLAWCGCCGIGCWPTGRSRWLSVCQTALRRPTLPYGRRSPSRQETYCGLRPKSRWLLVGRRREL